MIISSLLRFTENMVYVITSFLMPIGEHLLKIVEQLEIVTSTTSDNLAAFRSILTEERGDDDEKTRQDMEVLKAGEKGNEWKSLNSELARYGEQHERSALNNAELPLKDGVVGNWKFIILVQ